jgi:hypothetical protein
MKPYLKLFDGRKGMNDWLQIQLYGCNRWGFCSRIMGYGFDIGVDFNEE